jgi:hypothetical protein
LKYVESSKVVAGSGSAVMKFSKFEISWCGVKSSGVSDMKNFALTAQLAVLLLHHSSYSYCHNYSHCLSYNQSYSYN